MSVACASKIVCSLNEDLYFMGPEHVSRILVKCTSMISRGYAKLSAKRCYIPCLTAIGRHIVGLEFRTRVGVEFTK